MKLDHEKLDVYRVSLEFACCVGELLKKLPSGHADAANQLKRATLSILNNIAEGTGKTGKHDKQRFYAIARGSTYECASTLDFFRALQILPEDDLLQAKQLLVRIASMLSVLVARNPHSRPRAR